jgi:hypothetical protein
MANKLIWGSDFYKGYKAKSPDFLTGAINDILPFQMLSLEEKTIDWIKAVADYYESAGWNNVEKKAAKIQRNFQMRYGKLNPNDYVVDPANELSKALDFVLPQEQQSPLEQFYPLAPNFVDVLRGEFIKRDNRWTIEAIDPFSTAEAFDFKKQQFEQAVSQFALQQKAQTLAGMGIGEDDPQFQQELMNAQKTLTDIEFKSKNFRTTGVKWAEKVVKIQDKRYNLDELEPDAFESGLITDSEFWHIDLLEDDFKLELLNPKWCDYHKGPNIKYVSDGDYFLWFDWMSTGDIVNKFGRRMKEEDLLKLKEVFAHSANLIIPDSQKNYQGAYYDPTKPYMQATDLDPKMNDTLLGRELAYNYMRTPNFDHNLDSDLFNPIAGRMQNGHPSMFRVMRLYWRSMRRIGWLTKVDRSGEITPPEWVDEHFRVTVDPVYDKSVLKTETKDNLLYGEHIDWTWAPEWRHVLKISPNLRHSYWMDTKNSMESIYIDGAPVKFQFKGRTNPFDSLPPVEGCNFSYINTDPHSFIDRIRPMQILYNICMNRVPKKFLEDFGNKVAIDRRIMSGYNAHNTATHTSIQDEYEDKLRNSSILDYTLSRDALDGMGNPALPSVLPMSTIQDAMYYFQLGQQIKMEAGEIIGINRNRQGQSKPSEKVTNAENNISFSESQTEKYFEQHSNLMERVRQRMLDAAQYFTTLTDSSRAVYMNERDENVFLDIEGMENLLPHYNINLVSRANVRSALQTISQLLMKDNTMPIKPSAKVEALVDSSIPKILSLIKEGELEQEKMEQEKQANEMQMRQQELEVQQQMQAEKLQNENTQKDLDRQSQERIAEIRALGGLQSDINADGAIDSQQNLDNFFRQQELQDKKGQARDQLEQKRQSDMDKNMVEREKMQKEIEKEKIKQKGALEVAKQNKNKYDGKKK